MGDPETLSAGREPETLSVGPEPNRATFVRVSRTSAVGVCVALVVIAGVAWAGSRWLSERQARELASRQVAVEFVLQTAELDAPDDLALSQTWKATVTGVLVNSGPGPLVVQRVAWAGAPVDGGPYTVSRQAATPTLSATTTVECRPGQQTLVPMPAVRVRILTAANTVSDLTPIVLDADLWDEAVGRSCLSNSVPSPEDRLVAGSVRYVSSGSTLTVMLEISNPGSVDAVSLPSLQAEGFRAVAFPSQVTVAAGKVVHATLRVTVADCRLAQTGGVDGLNLSTNNSIGGDSDLVRQLDRLATRTCA
jgi:hypothetical protein